MSEYAPATWAEFRDGLLDAAALIEAFHRCDQGAVTSIKTHGTAADVADALIFALGGMPSPHREYVIRYIRGLAELTRGE